MAKKMLIDATHPEETRVVVADGNKVEEFDFESLNKRQLAGNIYLAKVTRVEPSLQAAFVDYGGNRHGFLAFSEIHPDYYQIPKADRDALLAEERAYAEAQAAADEASDAKASGTAPDGDTDDATDDKAEEAPKKSRSRSRSRSRKKKVEVDASDADTADAVETQADAAGETQSAPDDATAQQDTPEDQTAPAEQEAASAEDATSADAKPSEVEAPADVVVSGTAAEVSEAATTDTATPEDQPEQAAQSDDDDGPVTTIAEDTGLEDETVVSEEPSKAPDEDASTPSTDEVATPAEPAGMETVDLADETTDTAEAAPIVDEPAPKPRSRSRSRRKSSGSTAKTDNADTAEQDTGVEKDTTVETVADPDDQEDIRPVRKPRPRKYKIQEVVKVRQIMLVQVVKEERGNKGAALTTYLSLAGRYCVLMPNTARGGGISRKITNAVDRKKLKEIAQEIDVPQGAGLIVRTAGAKRTKTEIKRDYEYLQRQWEQVRELTLKSIAPAPIYEEGNLIHRSIRDLYSRDIDEVIVEGEAGYRHAKDYMKLIMPSHAKNVKHHPEGGQPLFAQHGVEQYLSSMFNPTVQLKSGGYIVIGITEALVAIDVNSGKSTKEGSIEDTAVKTNLEAADEVARQAKLRDLAGLIVIDFIDMDERKNNAAVEKRMKDALKNDRARIQVGRISGFGLLEMSRQRLRPGMLEATTQECPHCHGTGLIRSDDSVALQVLRALEEEGVRKRSREVLLKLPVDVCNYIMNDKREHLASIETRYGMAVRVVADAALIAPDFTMEKFKTATRQVPKPASQVVAMDTSWTPSEDEEEEVIEAEVVEEATEEAATQTPSKDASGDAEDGAPRKKRRRRSRRRKSGSGEGNGDGQEASETDAQTAEPVSGGDAAAEEAPADDAPNAEAPAADAAPKSRSRSRTRSRSKKVTDAASEAEPTSEAQPETAATEVAAPEADLSEATAPEAGSAEPEAQDETTKPKRRRSRSRAKAPAADAAETPVVDDAPVAETTNAEPVVTEDAPAAPEPEQAPAAEAKPAKRTRTRARAPAPVAQEGPSDAVEAAAETVAEIAPAPEAETPAPEGAAAEAPVTEPDAGAADTATTEAGDETPKKRGWWSFGS
ncbi:Rne/Rng family ribonuclease [Jannaschia sp. 2305UL9-9]|uniref:Rne/Rng family ribonuclease n=1 Tax=Jannaschia sp. 2305UL9-9 TaxID=3121638 RepID=UPI0035291422